MQSPADDDYEDDLEARLAEVFEERGMTLPPPRERPRPAAPPTQAAAPAQAAPQPKATPKPAAGTPPATSPTATPRRSAAKSAAPSAPPAARRSGRREKTMLLGMLGTLTGAFAGVLSMKLFVPRPPLGTGPDVHVAAVDAAPLEIVDPPALSALPEAPASLPDPFLALGAPAAGGAAADIPAAPRTSAFSREGSDRVATAPEFDAMSPAPGRFTPGDPLEPTPPPDLLAVPDALPATRADVPGAVVPAGAFEVPSAAPGGHLVREGDSWWGIAEGAYGDGRYYKALVAWNRSLDPRTNLEPGTRLDVPPEPVLRGAFGRLMPPPAR